MTIELILWLVGIGAAFCAIIAVFNHYENKQIRKRRTEADKLAAQVYQSIKVKPENERPDSLIKTPKPKQETVRELKDEIGEEQLIREKVTAGDEVIYETERLAKVINVGKDHETVIPLDVKEPDWADAMRESADQASKAGITKEYVLGPHEHVIDPRLKYKDKPKTIDDRVRELALKKKGSKPFYKSDEKKEWE